MAVTNHAPVLTVPSANVSATAGQSIAASSLFGATDADGDALTYYLYDNTPDANSGHFVVNGVVVTAQTPTPVDGGTTGADHFRGRSRGHFR